MNDNVKELIELVKQLQTKISTLETMMAKLDRKVRNINVLSKLLDVNTDDLTEGDILYYDIDGKWHNTNINNILQYEQK